MEEACTAIVCGSRLGPPSEAGWGWTHEALDAFDRERRLGHVIQGGAAGYDRLAAGWASRRRRIWSTVEADWDRHGRAAGPLRNADQLAFLVRITEPHERLVLAFPGGAGTEGMVRLAREAGVPVWRCSLVEGGGFRWMVST